MAMPPCDLWPLGRYDAMLFAHDSTNPAPLPDVGLDGECVEKSYFRPLIFLSRIFHRPDPPDPLPNMGHRGH